jgi:hypothetical protein
MNAPNPLDWDIDVAYISPGAVVIALGGDPAAGWEPMEG